MKKKPAEEEEDIPRMLWGKFAVQESLRTRRKREEHPQITSCLLDTRRPSDPPPRPLAYLSLLRSDVTSLLSASLASVASSSSRCSFLRAAAARCASSSASSSWSFSCFTRTELFSAYGEDNALWLKGGVAPRSGRSSGSAPTFLGNSVSHNAPLLPALGLQLLLRLPQLGLQGGAGGPEPGAALLLLLLQPGLQLPLLPLQLLPAALLAPRGGALRR
ncbi:hypothetical protein EYF80_061613 [Liparis tanakae]|uniref:Uncharacterized protein n=1 Tax=Liparis tanakae TaxID=230148 RepID=A0A4Z2EHD7_9TELE|nr:hypothetical protein EYF80_061613 [Liparis tanakae]